MTIGDIEQQQSNIKFTLTQLKNAFIGAKEMANADLISQTIDLIENMMEKIYAQDNEYVELRTDYNNYVARQHEPEDNTWSKGVIE